MVIMKGFRVSGDVVKESGRDLPVLKKVGVVIVGGGPAGVVAAIAASRMGVDTLLVERYGYLGGMVTGGFVTKPQGQLVDGIPREMLDRIVEIGGAKGHLRYRMRDGKYSVFVSPVDPETVKQVAFDMVEESQVKLLLHSIFVDTIVTEDDEVLGVIVESKGTGRVAILADVVVDATGDGDVAAKAGVSFDIKGRGDGVSQPMTLMFRMMGVHVRSVVQYAFANPEQFTFIGIPELDKDLPREWEVYALSVVLEGFFDIVKKATEAGDYNIPRTGLNVKTGKNVGEVFVNATRIVEGIGVNAEDLTWAEVKSRKQVKSCVNSLQKYTPGFENSYLVDTAYQIGVRETRRIIGEYILRGADIFKPRRYEDVVARVQGCAHDIHEPGGTGLEIKRTQETFIPFRSLVPKELENLLVAGRCISADHVAHGVTRLVPPCMYTGQAAGVAAALSSKLKIPPRNLDVKIIQETLATQNIEL